MAKGVRAFSELCGMSYLKLFVTKNKNNNNSLVLTLLIFCIITRFRILIMFQKHLIKLRCLDENEMCNLHLR